MFQDKVPRKLPERTGRHRCINCLAETEEEAYFRNDHVCDACAAKLDPPDEVEPADTGEAPEEKQTG